MKSKLLIMISIWFLVLSITACGNSLNTNEQIVLKLGERYMQDLSNPESFKVNSVKVYHSDNDGNDQENVWHDGLKVSYSADDNSGDVQQGFLVINTDNGEWLRYKKDELFYEDGSSKDGVTQKDVDLYYEDLALFLDQETQEFSDKSIKKINNQLSSTARNHPVNNSLNEKTTTEEITLDTLISHIVEKGTKATDKDGRDYFVIPIDLKGAQDFKGELSTYNDDNHIIYENLIYTGEEPNNEKWGARLELRTDDDIVYYTITTPLKLEGDKDLIMLISEGSFEKATYHKNQEIIPSNTYDLNTKLSHPEVNDKISSDVFIEMMIRGINDYITKSNLNIHMAQIGFTSYDPNEKETIKKTEPEKKSSPKNSSQSAKGIFTNKYGSPTTKCNHTGCNNYIASTGDTNCCELHSNNCLDCGKYIDEDAMYCMDCLEKAANSSKGKENSGSYYSYSSDKKTSKSTGNSSGGSFTNKFGTPATKCNHPGCNNYIASSGDTNCCVLHSNKCLECGKYIDEDAAYCIDCIEKALYQN